MKIACYTAITGGYEEPKTEQPFTLADFILFSDHEYLGNWKWRKATDIFADPRMNARYHKCLPHLYLGEYDYTIWMDGSLQVTIDPMIFISYMIEKKADILTFNHPDRDCIYDEAEEVLKLKLDTKERVDFQVDRLHKAEYPAHIGLSETRVVIRKSSPLMDEFNKEWFYQLATGSHRDQLSFDYVCRQFPLTVAYMTPIHHGGTGFRVVDKHKRREYA